MSTTVQATSINTIEQPINKTLLLIITAVIIILMVDPSAIDVVVSAVSEAYLAVSTFVAATLLLFFSIEKLLNLTYQLFWHEAAVGKFCLHRHLEHCRDVVEQSLLLQDMFLEI